ncbi:MAG: hypothetical protein IAX21_01335 [Candidatus Bathyarchaeota archaeon]|nr:MAG: hypothetical protein IAX21_01335 [Candidatus Bathyarchaeota archaeon]
MKYKITITVDKIGNNCTIYKTGDKIIIDKFYITTNNSQNIHIHAFTARSTLFTAVLYDSSTVELGIGTQENISYFQSPALVHSSPEAEQSYSN